MVCKRCQSAHDQTRPEHVFLYYKDGLGSAVVPHKQYLDTFRGVEQPGLAALCTFSLPGALCFIGVDRFAPSCGMPGAPMILESLQPSC